MQYGLYCRFDDQIDVTGVGIDVPFWRLVSHHLQISVGDYIPNSWVMFNWDIYQPLCNMM